MSKQRRTFSPEFKQQAACLVLDQGCSHMRCVFQAITRFVNIGNKNDAAGARAIWLAVQQPCKAVAVKPEDQQAVLAMHRTRQQLVKVRTMQINALRGLLTEYGEVMGTSRASLDKGISGLLERLAERLPAMLIDTLREQWNGLAKLDEQIATIERRLKA